LESIVKKEKRSGEAEIEFDDDIEFHVGTRFSIGISLRLLGAKTGLEIEK